jgi:preprotein translocase subunit YajC
MAIVFFAVILLLMWAVIVLPQQRRMKAHQALVSTLEVGDEVMTTSGIIGEIVEMDAEVATVEVAPGMSLRFVRGAIARKIEPGEEISAFVADDDEAEEDDDDSDDEIVLHNDADDAGDADVTEDAETS